MPSPDEENYRFLTVPGAEVSVRLTDAQEGPELQLFGNRAGLLSLANILLWLMANAFCREFLSISELPFVHTDGQLSLRMRLNAEKRTGRDGLLMRTDSGEQLEWTISEDDLQRVALEIHKLVSKPGHEYDRLMPAEESVADIHIRMTDVDSWFQKGIV